MSEVKQTIDRSKFKTTSVAAVQQADEQVEAMTSTRKSSTDFLDIKKGTGDHNYRIYPPHPDSSVELYAVPKAVHWIPRWLPSKDKEGNLIKDKEDKLVFEWREGPIFNARVHASQQFDLIEKYAEFAQKIAVETIFDSADKKKDEGARKKFLEPILGSPRNFTPGSPKPAHSGIIPLRQTWMMYAHELIEGIDADKKPILNTKFGLLEIGKAVKDRLNKLSASESSSEPLGTDPFTHLDDGKAVKIKYDKAATKAQDYYSTELYQPSMPGDKSRIKLFPITDDELSHFMTRDSLQKLFINSYTQDTFKEVLAGLKYFDDKNEIGVFAYEEFMNTVSELRTTLPEGKASSETEAEVKDGDAYDKMDRDELKAFNKDNMLGIIVNRTMTDDMIRKAIREATELKGKSHEEEEEEEDGGSNTETQSNDLPFQVEPKKEEVEKSTGAPKAKESTAERLERLKNKK